MYFSCFVRLSKFLPLISLKHTFSLRNFKNSIFEETLKLKKLKMNFIRKKLLIQLLSVFIPKYLTLTNFIIDCFGTLIFIYQNLLI